MIKEAIVKIVNKEDLTYEEAYAVMNEIMSGQTSATPKCSLSGGRSRGHEGGKAQEPGRLLPVQDSGLLRGPGGEYQPGPARCRALLAPGIHAVGVFDRKLSGQVRRPYFLAGGLIPENSGEAIRQPAPYWVDISSGIETDGYFCSVHQNTASILKAA